METETFTTVHLQHSLNKDKGPTPELKWISWANGQRVLVEVPDEAGQGN